MSFLSKEGIWALQVVLPYLYTVVRSCVFLRHVGMDDPSAKFSPKSQPKEEGIETNGGRGHCCFEDL
ncbi:hypothetical protein SUGI_1063730 [Cryptomeria japonica]|nr:hypothetical protein SUGI_1063730 [Cryptomeria japonica]